MSDAQILIIVGSIWLSIFMFFLIFWEPKKRKHVPKRYKRRLLK